MTKSSRMIGVSFGVLTAFLVTACDSTDMVTPVLVDAYLNPHSSNSQSGGDGGGGGGY